MLISLKWIRDFVDLPTDIKPRDLAETFTCTTAEVETIQHVKCDATGLIAAEIIEVEAIPDTGQSFAVRVNLGKREVESVTVAEDLMPGDIVIYAPPGAVVPGIGEIHERQVSGRESIGMILPGDVLGMAGVGQRAVWLPPGTPPGSKIDMSLFEDWVVEVDNKSITHRPDLWGHYGIAREMAAIYGRELKPYPVVDLQEIDQVDLPEIPIVIDDPRIAPRYTGLRFTGVKPQPSPLWMQARLAHVGLRPIDILVDLTNYIMAELGQPMHAFDAANVDRIEVGLARPGETFATLDGVKRTMPEGALMIKCRGRSVAIAGVMGGLDTEVTETTTDLLLESANFEAATIRRCATAMGHRTDASARFEKSQDPHNTVLAIQRFVHLARPELPDMRWTSRLSDCFPEPPKPIAVEVDPAFVGRYIGRDIPTADIVRILTALDFKVAETNGKLQVAVPTFRATKDIAIEADVIEEVARFVGYGSIDPVPPEVTVRYAEPAAAGNLERQILTLLCGGMSYSEIHRYIWFDRDWLRLLNYTPDTTLELRNPSAAGMESLRTTLMPGMLASVDLNRHHFDRFELVEVGSVFDPVVTSRPEDAEQRHLGLIRVAPGRKTAHEDALLMQLKMDLETVTNQVLRTHVHFEPDKSTCPWEHEAKTARITIGDQAVGRLSVLPVACKRRIDEHLLAWSVVLAEINLSALIDRKPEIRKLVPLPVYPRIEVDFSVLTPADRHYAELEKKLAGYDHPLLRRLGYVGSYEGGSVPAGQRSLTFRTIIADPDRTLTDQDIQAFRDDFIAFLNKNGLTLRA